MGGVIPPNYYKGNAMKLNSADHAYVVDKAKKMGIEPAALFAVIEKESAGITGSLINGSFEPTIRYEGHYFDKLCKASVRESARQAGVSSPKAGVIKNPKSQANRWALLMRAVRFDPAAAYMSCSWGVGQVMGSHWRALGFASVNDLVSMARSGFQGQVDLMVRFIEVNNLVSKLKALDWSGYSRIYNGANYRKNNYDTDLERLYKKHGGNGTIDNTRSGYLRLGSKGAGVRDLQAMLKLAGFGIVVDGDFGEATDAAVRAFQQASSLSPDGIVGPKTNAALSVMRDTAPADAGQEKVTQIKEVQAGAAAGLGIPALCAMLKGELIGLIEMMTPYAYLSQVIDFLHMAIAFISVASIVAGIGYAVWGFLQSRKSFTGTKNDGVIPLVDEEPDGRIILPLAT